MTRATRRNIGQLDMDTGEILEGVFAWVPVRKKNGFTNGWFAMSQEAIAQILTLTIERKLTLRDLQTLYAMLEILDLENWIRVSQKHLADRLQMLQPNISRSMKTLTTIGIILKGPKVGTSHTYRLNPAFGWKGSAEKHKEALKDMRTRMNAANITGVIEGRDPATVDMFTGKADQEQQ